MSGSASAQTLSLPLMMTDFYKQCEKYDKKTENIWRQLLLWKIKNKTLQLTDSKNKVTNKLFEAKSVKSLTATNCISRRSWNPESHCHSQNSLPFVHTVSQKRTDQVITFLNINFIILPSAPGSSISPLSFKFPYEILHASLFSPCELHVPSLLSSLTWSP
jgi:hypothetical protein